LRFEPVTWTVDSAAEALIGSPPLESQGAPI
jgi:hypothetical protein